MNHFENLMILSCSGSSPAGRIADRAAVALTREGFGRMYCLSAIAAGHDGFVQSARDVDAMVVIDGCDRACGRRILEKAGIPLKGHVIVTGLDIREKNGSDPSPEDVATVTHAVRLSSKRPVSVTFDSPKPLSPGDLARSKMLGGRCC